MGFTKGINNKARTRKNPMEGYTGNLSLDGTVSANIISTDNYQYANGVSVFDNFVTQDYVDTSINDFNNSLADVAATGSYNDLDNKPDLGEYATETYVNTALGNIFIDELADVDTTTDTPTEGQALVFDSDSQTWKPSTVVPPVPAAQYLHAQLTTRRNLTPGTFIGKFDTFTSQGIDDGSVENTWKLKAGVTYELIGSFQLDGSATLSSLVTFRFETTTGIIVSSSGLTSSANHNTGKLSRTPVVNAIYTPSSDVEVGLVCLIESGSTATDTGYGFVTIKAISNQIPVNTDSINSFNDVDTTTSSSGYVDIGEVRMQWGTIPSNGSGGSSTGTYTFPAEFSDASYTITATPTSGNLTTSINLHVHNHTTSSFDYVKRFVNETTSGLSTEQFRWMAIGTKP